MLNQKKTINELKKHRERAAETGIDCVNVSLEALDGIIVMMEGNMDKWTELHDEIKELHENNADKPDVKNVTKFLLNFMSVLDERDDTHD